ncbi:MAG: SDR family NAD(P)-dependent oxidoreductase [Patescibacteria group bacterium]|nr:SDR family NAD(P)-dependent oxidoreductase [Patescibacteria group bacterium]
MPKKTILITGGAGFIGTHLAEKLLKSGEEVFVIDNLSTGSLKNIAHLKKNKKFHFTKDTILNRKKLENLIKKSDQIYHLAAAVGVKTIMEKPLESFLNNIKGIEIVLELASKYKKPILFTSSSEVYGKNDSLPFKEEDDRVYGSAYNDRWGYALSKGADEFLALAYFREKKLPVVVVRLFNVIGPRQTEAYGMVVPRFIKQALSGQPITVYGTGFQTRCFTDIEDVVEALVKLMNHPKAPGQIFNLGSEEEITIRELAQKIKKLTGSKSKIIFIPYTKVYGSGFEDMEHRKPDLTKIKKLINYQPKVTLEESLKKIIDYFHEN